MNTIAELNNGRAERDPREPPVDLPPITEMLWWHPRRTADPAHARIRDSIAAIAGGLGRAAEA